jgi:ABC-type glycerol-3-phosphate transport system substrate-binding protein
LSPCYKVPRPADERAGDRTASRRETHKGDFMTRATDLTGPRLDRRRLLQRVGGAAALATLGRTAFTIGANAQDALTITMWGNHPEWRDPMLEILAAFEESNPGITVEFTGIPGPDYPAKLQTAVAGGAPSDVLGALEGSILTQVAAGGELPFIDLSGKIDISGLTDTARGQVEVDGKVYGTPLASYTVGIAYQKPIFAEHGLEPPTTWQELKDVAQALQDAGVTPIVLGAKDWVHPYFMYIGLSSAVMGPEGFDHLRAGERKLTDPDLVEAAQLLLDLQPFYQSGFQATDYVTAKAIFANGQGAMQVAGTADFSGYREVNPGLHGLAGTRGGQVFDQHRHGAALHGQPLRHARGAGGGDQARGMAGNGGGAADGL